MTKALEALEAGTLTLSLLCAHSSGDYSVLLESS